MAETTTSANSSNRIIAIGDIHGCSAAFDALISSIQPGPQDTVITLGDYVGRGPDTKGVLNQLIDLSQRCRLVTILGNHDEMMLQAKDGVAELQFWLQHRGLSALTSYGSSDGLDQIPVEHFQFLERCTPYFETDTHFFVHANYLHEQSLAETSAYHLRWLSLRDAVPAPHVSGKIAVMGHTPHREILDMGHLICLDTGVCRGGWLTAFEVNNRQCWQVDVEGKSRVPKAQAQFLTEAALPLERPLENFRADDGL